MSGAAWTKSELAFVRDHYRSLGPEVCAERLPHRSLGALRQRARCLSVARTCEPWRASELSLLLREYPVGGPAGCAAVLRGRSEASIANQASRHGLSAPPLPTLKKLVAVAAVLRRENRLLREKVALIEAGVGSVRRT